MPKRKMSNAAIENTAVDKIKKLIFASSILKPYISSNDKTECWDGCIMVFENESNKKKPYVRKIHVQVKGTLVEEFSIDSISCKVEMSDLKSYLYDNGVIYFVVQVKDTENAKIFYKALLPTDINEIIDQSPTNKTKHIRLTHFNYDTSESSIGRMECLFKNFLLNREQQKPDSRFMKVVDHKVLHANLYLPEYNSLSYWWEDPPYLYAEINNEKKPVKRFDAKNIILPIDNDVSIDGKVYFNQYNICVNQDLNQILIGNGIIMKERNIRYTIIGSLHERINSFDFISHLMKFKKFKLGDEIKEVHFEDQDNYNILLQHRNFLENVKILLDFLGVKEDLQMDLLKENDLNLLLSLIDSILFNKRNTKGESGFKYFILGNIKLIMFVELDSEGFVKFYNFFDRELLNKDFEIQFSEDIRRKISPCVMLKFDDMITSHNVNYEEISNSVLDRPLSVKSSNYTTLLVIELIKVFDEYNKINNELLGDVRECIEKINDYLIDFDQNDKFTIVNKLQLNKRNRKLNTDEIMDLQEMKKNEDNNMMLCAICTLLESKAEYHMYFDLLSNEERAEYITFPIFTLAQHTFSLDDM